ncbi:MAG: hypothetical protein ACFFCS_17155 [Candidatus Hodarchaeota archaeon]
MKNRPLFILNLVAILSFVLYAIGIYIQVVYQGIEWGNVAVNLALQVLGPLLGVIVVVLIGAAVLLSLYAIKRLQAIDIFLCWFWIISLYQCAINSFLQFNGLPDEPINQFFKFLFPDFWYPVKEVAFIIASLLLTIWWMKKVQAEEMKRADYVIVLILGVVMVGGTVISQLFLMNA